MNLDKLKEDLVRDEGNIPHAYQDGSGYWTIGIGHLIDKRMGGKLDEEVIELQFRKDVEEKISELDEHIPWWRDLDEVRQRAIVNMAFNLGVVKENGKLLQFKRLLAAVKNNTWDSNMTNETKKTPWANQVGKRADRIIHMLETGSDP